MSGIYGINPVREALKKGRVEGELLVQKGKNTPSIESIIKTAKKAGIIVRRSSREELTREAGAVNHQGLILLTASAFKYADIVDVIEKWKKSGEKGFFVLLDSVQDPQNLGSILRTAHSAGACAVIIPKDRSVKVTSVAVKASAGAAMHIPVAIVTNMVQAIKTLKEEGVWVYGIEAECGESVYSFDLTGDVAIVIGSEGEGIRRLVSKECDQLMNIPMKGEVNSLNAAQAGAVTFFEVLRQREAKG
ncbi:MAG: 23S rRNA (guanosine(2251)-2'-O)-methyltransferase RlmB [Deltaproteobacteria bacterium]|nr:23S rRNA (guanosine(2251)-2'-O)-methyltransferase RlmB [Deltaproteobacteria bacterium]